MPKHSVKCLGWFRPPQSALTLSHTEIKRRFDILSKAVLKTNYYILRKILGYPNVLFQNLQT